MADVLRIGNAQGFWGDWPDAPAALAAQAPEMDYLTLDYLAEVSMSILAKQREREAEGGYAKDFIEVVRSLAPVWRGGRRLRVVSNAGGLNPSACGRATAVALREAGCAGMKVGVVSGDDVLEMVRAEPESFPHLESGAPLSSVLPRLVTANAYLGAAGVVEALAMGADLVVTGRVADPSLAVGPCIHHFGWGAEDWDRIAGATVAGHLIECGTQATGGISTDWLTVPDVGRIGYPIVEVSGDGSCVLTKAAGTGGRVDLMSVKEQLVYEIGDPGSYLSPDATVSFLALRVEEAGADRVRVWGATGRPPPEMYKVSATYRAGFRASGMLTIVGPDAVAKARRCGEVVLRRLEDSGHAPAEALVECLGAGDAQGGLVAQSVDAPEVVLRITVADERREMVERFSRQVAALVTCGPQGTTGYAEGRPPVREVFAYWPALIPRGRVRPRVEVIGV